MGYILIGVFYERLYGPVSKWPKRPVTTNRPWTVNPVSVSVQATCRVSHSSTRVTFSQESLPFPILPRRRLSHGAPRNQGGGGDCHRQLSHGSKLLTKLNFLSGLGVEWPLGLISSGGGAGGGGGVKGHLIPPQSPAARKSPDSRGIGDGHWLRCANKKKIALVKCSWIIVQKKRNTIKPK